MRAGFGWVLAFLGFLVAAAPTSFAEIPRPALLSINPATHGPAATYPEQTLYSFCAQTNCIDGAQPEGPLIMDAAGNLYGTTGSGGKYISGGGGVVFKLTPNQNGTGWNQTILYTFCAQSHCTDGSVPNSLIMDIAGNLYGTTAYGGSTASDYGMGAGTVFKLVPTTGGWTHTVLYNFASRLYVVDGQVPLGTLIMDSAGSLYGTTFLGGRNYEGAVFRLTPNQDGTAWTETVLNSFCSQYNGNACLDGQTPRAGLVMDEAGNLFGTTTSGGTSNQGVVFRLTPNLNPAAPWAETVIHSFDSRSGDGAEPEAGLIIDQAGNLYGTNLDTVFQLRPNADHTAWTHTVLYRFCPQSPSCSDGTWPRAPVIMDAGGNLYGTTYHGGSSNQGVVFALSLSSGGWTESVLYSFCAHPSCIDGGNPSGGFVMDNAGTLYGTTDSGGTGMSPYGVVFSLGAGNSLTVSESGNGRVTSSPAGIDCPGSCAASFAPGTQVTLTASGASGSSFSGWGGACSGTGSCVVTMNASQSVTAAFAANYALAVSVIGSPGGRVTSSPSGIDCGATCSAGFSPMTQVTLTATPDAGWGFAGWSGACSGMGTSCTVTLNANASASASFATLFGIGAGPLAALPTDAAALLPPIIAPIPQ
jgi:uncharacterized repeat protein (TIGR03803 family)